MKIRERDGNRLHPNLELLRILETYLKADPGMRFSQALINLDMVRLDKDDFYTEPTELLKRVYQTLEGG